MGIIWATKYFSRNYFKYQGYCYLIKVVVWSKWFTLYPYMDRIGHSMIKMVILKIYVRNLQVESNGPRARDDQTLVI